MAEWIRRLTTDQEIQGSSPGRVNKKFFWKHRVSISEPLACKASALPIELYPRFLLAHSTRTFLTLTLIPRGYYHIEIKLYNKGKQWLLVCHILVCIYIKLKSKTREKRKNKLSLQACILFRNWDGKFNIYVGLSHFHDYILGKSMNSLKAILISIGNIVIYHVAVLWLCSHPHFYAIFFGLRRHVLYNILILATSLLYVVIETFSFSWDSAPSIVNLKKASLWQCLQWSSSPCLDHDVTWQNFNLVNF